jgi:hypothetical protein
MMKSINGTVKKRRGRPATGVGTSINVRLHGDALERLDSWIADQDDKPSRPEALRRLFELGLDAGKRSATPAEFARALKAKPSPTPTARPGAKKSAKATTKAGPLKKARPRRP